MMSAAENVLYCSNDTSAWNSFARRSLLKAPKVVVARRLMQQSLVEGGGLALASRLCEWSCTTSHSWTAPLAMDILQVWN